jgi:hypothetical protein
MDVMQGTRAYVACLAQPGVDKKRAVRDSRRDAILISRTKAHHYSALRIIMVQFHSAKPAYRSKPKSGFYWRNRAGAPAHVGGVVSRLESITPTFEQLFARPTR